MIARFAYDPAIDPPAPLVPVRISRPLGADAVLLPMLIDTGADCTLVPARIVRELGLPRVDVIGLRGISGARQRATVHAAAVALGGQRLLARVVAFVDEAILGRDLLNQTIVTLDGPALAVSLRDPRPARRARRPV